MKLLTTSVVRGSQQGQSHGGVYLVDLEAQSVLQTLDWNKADIDWQGRGWDRGLRGIAFDGDQIYIAASDELFAFSPDFRRIASWRNRYLKHCHSTLVTAAVVGALYPGLAAHAQADDVANEGIEEVIVTATKREMNLQDLPQSITAFSTSDIEKMAFRTMEDYMKALPSTSLVTSMPGRNSIAMRGITTGAAEYRTDSQVAVYLDEQPVTSISRQPEIRMIDIERLESLPGPQGTLFGSSSQSGTLRIITNKPNFDGFSGQADGTVELITEGDESYDVSGHLNIPLVDDTLALRVVGFWSRDGGYVDNVEGPTFAGPGAHGSPGDNSAIAKEDQNIYEVWGGRVAALWSISDNWTADFSYIMQGSAADGVWESDPYLGDYKVARFFEEYRDDDWWQVSATFRGDLGFAEFVSTTSNFERESSYEWDNMQYNQWQTSYYANYLGFALYDFEYEFGSIFNFQIQERFAQEFRLTSLSDSKLQWIVGAFYEDIHDAWEYSSWIPTLMETNAWEAANNGWDNYVTDYYGNTYLKHYDGACDYAAQGYDIACPLEPTTKIGANNYDKTIKQTAVFGELTYNITDAWAITAGARWFQFDRADNQVYQTVGQLPMRDSVGAGDGVWDSSGKNDDSVFKLATQYHFSDGTMAYALYSEGFRLGGHNSPKASATGVIPAEYGPDTLRNYEIGMKSEWLDNKLLINVSAFLMEWQDIQINITGEPWWLHGTFNGETGESRGLEISGEWQATRNLSFEGSAYFAKSEYTADTYSPFGTLWLEDGQEMPNVPKEKYWAAVEYTLPEVLGGDLWFRYDTSYQGESWVNLNAAIDNDPEGFVPSWKSSNLQVGLTFETWDVTLMARNVWDDRGFNSLARGNLMADWFDDPRFRNMRTIQQPRTYSLSVRKSF